MRSKGPSATARLIAESTIFLAGDPGAGRLVPARAAELSALFVPANGGVFRWPAASGVRRSLSRFLLTRAERALLPGIQLHYALRKRHIEEAARAALAAGTRRLVVFGAGFDTLALRLAETFTDARFYELDHPATQSAKTGALAGRAPRNLNFIPADLARDDGAAALLLPENGYRADLPTFFVAEGLTMYLARPAVESLFRFARSHSGAGSIFAFTFFEPGADGRLGFRASSPLVGAWLRLRGEPFRWGASREELGPLLAAHGFEIQEIATGETLARRYLPHAGLSRLRAAEGECVCIARLAGSEP